MFLFTRLLLFFNITIYHVVKLYVIILMPFFNLTLLCVLSFFVTYQRVVIRETRWLSLVEQKPLVLYEHLGSLLVFVGLLNLYIFCCESLIGWLFLFLLCFWSFFFWQLYCMSFFVLWPLITPLVSTNVSCHVLFFLLSKMMNLVNLPVLNTKILTIPLRQHHIV